jgi:hypothetical protein
LGTKAAFAPRATHVQVQSEQLIVQLADSRQIRVPLAWFPRLQAGSPEQCAGWRLIGEGSGIHWDELDEDVSVAGLLGLRREV